MLDPSSIDTITGSKAVDRDGGRVGTVQQVYVDETDGHPLFATVHTGLFGGSESFVPVQDATFDGKVLHVAYDKETIKGAPNVAADGSIDDAEQDRIYEYYGIGSTTGAPQTSGRQETGQQAAGNRGTGTTGAVGEDRRSAGTGEGDTTSVEPRAGSTGSYPDRTQGHDTSGPTTDDAMTRSEERLHVGTERVQTGRARLRKHIVTERQTVEVPLVHEEARVEREPITDANVGAANAGPSLSEEEHEVVLTAEVPDVTKETVPVERVRLGTESVTEQRQVTEEVGSERIELEGDGSSR